MSSSEYRDTLHLRYTREGITGIGEGAPIVRYNENAELAQRVVESVRDLLTSADPWQFSKVMDEQALIDLALFVTQAQIDTAELINAVTVSAIIATLFLGGWWSYKLDEIVPGDALRKEWPRRAEIPFDSAAKMMATQPGAMQLRTLQTIDGLGPTPSNTVIILPATSRFSTPRGRSARKGTP